MQPNLVHFKSDVPRHIKNFLLSPCSNLKLQETNTVIQRLKECANLSHKIILNNYSILKKFHAIETSDEKKKIIRNLITEILFGKNVVNRPKIEKLLNQEFWIQETPPDDLSVVLNSAGTLLSKVPSAYRNSQLIEHAVNLFTSISDQQDRQMIMSVFENASSSKIVDILTKSSLFFSKSDNAQSKLDILRIIESIPQSQWKDVIAKANPFLDVVKDGYGKIKIIATANSISHTQRLELIESCAPLLKSITNPDTIIKTLQFLNSVPKKLRKDVISYSQVLLHNLSCKECLPNILKFIYQIPHERRSFLMQESSPILDSMTDGFEKINFLQLMLTASPDLWHTIIENAVGILEILYIENKRDTFLKIFIKHPISQWLRVVVLSEPLLRYANNTNYKLKVLEAALDISPDDVESVMKYALALMSESDSLNDKISTLCHLKQIPTAKRKDAIKKSITLFCKKMSCLHKVHIARALAKLPEEDRESIVNLTKLIIQNHSSVEEKERFFAHIYRIPKEKRSLVLLRALPYMNEFHDAYGKCEMLNYIKSIPEEEWEDVELKSVKLRSRNPKTMSFQELMKALLGIPKAKRDEIVSIAEPFFMHFSSDSMMSYLLRTVYSIDEKDRIWAVVKTKSLLNKDEKIGDAVITILKKFSKIPIAESDHLLKISKSLMNDKKEGLEDILEVMVNIPPKEWDGVLNDSKLYFEFVTEHSPRSKVLKLMSDVPSNKRDALLVNMRPIIAYNSKSSDVVESLTALSKIPEDEHAEVIERALNFARENKFDNIGLIIQIIGGIPKNQRQKVIEKSRVLLELKPKGDRNANILTVINETPENQREDVIKRSAALAKQFDIDVTLIVTAVYAIPENRRDLVISTSIPLLLTYKNSFKIILEVIDSIKESKLEETIKAFGLLSSYVTSGSAAVEILKAISKISEFDHDDVIHKSLKLCPKELGLANVIQIMRVISPLFRDEVIEDAKQFFKEEISGKNIGQFLFVVDKIPSSHRLGLFKLIEPLFKEIDSVENKIAVLDVLDKITESELQDILAISEPLIKILKNFGDQIAGIIMILSECSSSERLDIVNKTLALLGKTIQKKGIHELVQYIARAPIERRVQIVETVKNLIAGIDTYNQDKAKIIINLTAIPENETEEIVCLSQSLLEGVENPLTKSEILLALSEVESSQRIDVAAKIKSYIPKFKFDYQLVYFITSTGLISKEERTPELMDAIYTICTQDSGLLTDVIKFIAPEKRVQAIQILTKDLNLISSKTVMLLHFFRNHEDIKTASHLFLQKSLEVALSDNKKALALADTIIRKNHELNIMELDVLYQAALEIHVRCSPQNVADVKNPQKLYLKLKEGLKNPLTPISLPQYSKDFEVQYTSKTGELLPKQTLQTITSLNIDFMRKQAQQIIGFTIGDLPQNVGPESLKKLFNAHNDRLSKLSKREKVEVENYMSANYTTSLAELSKNPIVLPLITNMLGIKGSPTTPIENTVVYLFYIFKAILEANNTHPLDGSPLTLQETLLANFFKVVKECATGQRDGVVGFYNILDAQDRYTGLTGEMGNIERIDARMHETLQKILNDIFHSESLFRILIGKGPGDQASHQTLFLKNRYGPEIGFIHRLIFDLYSKTILDELLELDTKFVLNQFFKLCTPENICRQLKHDLSQILEAANKIVDSQLAESLAAYKKNTTYLKILVAIEFVLKQFKKGKSRLTQLIYNDKVLSTIPKFAALPMSNIEKGIREYFDDKIASKFEEYYSWQENYLVYDEDGLFLKGVTDLGALELLRAKGYFNVLYR